MVRSGGSASPERKDSVFNQPGLSSRLLCGGLGSHPREGSLFAGNGVCVSERAPRWCGQESEATAGPGASPCLPSSAAWFTVCNPALLQCGRLICLCVAPAP